MSPPLEGEGLAGVDSVPTNLPTNAATPFAVFWDPGTGATLFDENGEAVEIHPVDHAVAVAMGIELGSLPVDPTLGNGVRKALSKCAKEQRQAAAQYAVSSALRRLLSSRDISLTSVTVDDRKRTVNVVYVNRRISTPSRLAQPVTTGVPF